MYSDVKRIGRWLMRFHAIDKLVFTRGNQVIDWFHVDLFHGKELTPFRNAEPDVLRPPRPLRLWKNLYNLADVFEPATPSALVVSERVKDELSGLPNVGFLP